MKIGNIFIQYLILILITFFVTSMLWMGTTEPCTDISTTIEISDDIVEEEIKINKELEYQIGDTIHMCGYVMITRWSVPGKWHSITGEYYSIGEYEIIGYKKTTDDKGITTIKYKIEGDTGTAFADTKHIIPTNSTVKEILNNCKDIYGL